MKSDAAGLAAGQQGAHQTTALRQHHGAPGDQILALEGGVDGQRHAGGDIGDTHAVRTQQSDAGGGGGVGQGLLAGGAFRTILGETIGQDRDHRHAGRRASLHRGHRRGRVEQDISVIHRLRQGRQTLPGRLALDRLAARIDRINRAFESVATQIAQGPAGGAVGVVRGTDQSDAPRIEKGVDEGGGLWHRFPGNREEGLDGACRPVH